MFIYLILGIFIFGLNVVPAFMPPTWIVLAFFYIHYHLGFFPTVFVGVISATLGRVVLAILARDFLEPYIPKSWNKHYDELGKFLSTHQNLTIPFVLGYAFLPIPSNAVYIIAGLSNLDLRLIAFSFMVGRLISYSFWIGTSKFVGRSLGAIFAHHFSGRLVWLPAELFSLLVVIIIGAIDWRKIIGRVKSK